MTPSRPYSALGYLTPKAYREQLAAELYENQGNTTPRGHAPRRFSRRRYTLRVLAVLSLDPIAERYSAKCCRTFAAIWRSVILSTVSTPAMCPPRFFP